jgi:hypothetical protein
MISPETIPVAQVIPSLIKQEKLSENVKNFIEDSEIMCVGSLPDEIIEVSDDSIRVEQLVQAMHEEVHEENPFLMAINQGTPPVANSTMSSSLPESTRLRDRQHLRESNSQPEAETQPSTLKRRSPRLSKPSTKASKRLRSSRKQQATTIDYLDESDQEGNDDAPPQPTPDALNDDFSVFLSSQLVEEREVVAMEVEQSPFVFVQPVGDQEVPSETECFVIQLQNVFFEKNVKFELQVNLPQFNVFNAIIEDENIQNILNLSETEFAAVSKLLDTLGRYYYTCGQSTRRLINASPDEVFITSQLDLFFSSQLRFKNFKMDVDGVKFTCFQGTSAAPQGDLTSAIPPDILRRMKSI